MNLWKRSGRSTERFTVSESLNPTPALSRQSSTDGQRSDVIFNVDLERSVAFAHIRLQVKDGRGEMRTCQYIPIVLAKCAMAIKEATIYEGLFDSSTEDFAAIESLIPAFQTSPKYGKSYKWRSLPPKDVPRLARALYVKYLTSLPEPVVPRDSLIEFLAVLESSSHETVQDTSRRYADVLCGLGMSNMYVLLYTIDLLDIVSRQASLHISDISRIFASVLFRPQSPSEESAVPQILEYLINHRDLDATILELNQNISSRPLILPASPQSPTTTSPASPAIPPTLERVPDISRFVQKEGSDWIHRGGFCEIYAGSYYRGQGNPAEKVALRFPSLRNKPEQAQRRFWREVEIWFGLEHPHINPLYGTYSDNRGFHMVSPWRNRGNVRDCLNTDTPIQHLVILIGIARALVYLHDTKDCVHGDLKLENILLSDEGEALLTDFGLSRQINFSISTSTDSAGSIPWFSPEILMGGKKSKASDVYAFGMVIAELLTRRTPFEGTANIGSVIMKIMNGDRPSKDDIVLNKAPRCWQELWAQAEACWQIECPPRPMIRDLLHSLEGMIPT